LTRRCSRAMQRSRRRYQISRIPCEMLKGSNSPSSCLGVTMTMRTLDHVHLHDS
jgi:hypothetical protein